MRPERYARVREVFLAARERAPEERRRYLEEACAQDGDLRAEVETLLEQGPTSFLETPALGARAEIPASVGRYKVLSVLGQGGMGVVYLAEQESPRRSVALKVIQPGISSPARLKRLEHEAELLGRLQHPNVAQVYEAGTADAGAGPQPWFAMELVRGEPLTLWAEERELRTRQRLSLFVKVCAGVQHAHEKGVIHRDLKPGNILVDERGEPKILDFGVARATDSDLATATLRTDVGQIVGTLPYMSPEQVAGDSRKLDTRSDVYALGVIGYELLAGCLPYDVRAKPLPEAARIIREEDPTRLSSVNRVFRGDLDTIFAKALEKDPERRYRSAAELAADVERYLADQPIQARPPSAAYQLSKFARRNKALVGGAIGIFLALLLGIAGTTTGLLRANEAAEEARKEARKAKAVTDFLRDTFAAANPSVQSRDAKIVDGLDRAAEKVGSAFPGEPEIEAALRDALGTTYRSLGWLDKAEVQLVAAFDLLRGTLPGDHRDRLEVSHDLASLWSDLDRLAEAEHLFREVLAARETVLGTDDPDTLMTRSNLAIAIARQGRLREAEEIEREALETRRRVLGEDHEDTLSSINNLCVNLRFQGRHAEAEDLVRAILELVTRRRGPEHPATLTARCNLADALKVAGKLSEAEAEYRAILAAETRVLGDDHPSVQTTTSNLAAALWGQGKLAEAELSYRRVVEILREKLGETHSQTLSNRSCLARVLQDAGRLEEALPIYREVLAGWSQSDEPDPIYEMNAADHLTVALRLSGQLDEATRIARDNLGKKERLLPPGHEGTRYTRYLLGQLLRLQGRFDEAVERLRPALAEYRAAGVEAQQLSVLEMELSRCLSQLGSHGEALELARSAWERHKTVQDPSDPTAQKLLRAVIEVCERAGDAEGAAALRTELAEGGG